MSYSGSINFGEKNSYTTIIDRMCDANKKFKYFSTADGMVINHKITRISENSQSKKSYKDDAYSAFLFFMALYSQIFSSA